MSIPVNVDATVVNPHDASMEMIRLFGEKAIDIARHSIAGFAEQGNVDLVNQWESIAACLERLRVEGQIPKRESDAEVQAVVDYSADNIRKYAQSNYFVDL